MSERAGGYEPILKEASDSRRLKRFSCARTILTSARICLNNIARSGGWGSNYTPSFFELRENAEGEYYHLVTLWKSTKEERQLYEEHS